jgi:hypothetical protein
MSATGPRTALALTSLCAILTLTACSAAEDDATTGNEEQSAEDPGSVEEAPEDLVFTLPNSCLALLPEPAIGKFTSGTIGLLRGPGSGSTESVYPEGPSPQEERGGISCLFGNSDETQTYTLSVAPVTQASRSEVIDGLLAQQLNPGQTVDGALTYWIEGDDAVVPAIYNALYPDAWYEVLIFPGGRLAYEESESLVAQMRAHTTG